MLKHGDFSPQDDHCNDQSDRDGRPDDAEYPDVDRVVGRAEFARGPLEETHALAEDEVDHWGRRRSVTPDMPEIVSGLLNRERLRIVEARADVGVRV